MKNKVLFTVDEANEAGKDWGFNCGPAAICALLDKTPADIRPDLQDFEAKKYTNPRLMRAILDGLKVSYRWEVVPVQYPKQDIWYDNSLIRIQWGGPWTGPAQHWGARQRHTHWIACRHNGATSEIFDINATCDGGWIPIKEWEEQLVPWLLRECEPKADGLWWQTHRCVIERKEGKS